MVPYWLRVLLIYSFLWLECSRADWQFAWYFLTVPRWFARFWNTCFKLDLKIHKCFRLTVICTDEYAILHGITRCVAFHWMHRVLGSKCHSVVGRGCWKIQVGYSSSNACLSAPRWHESQITLPSNNWYVHNKVRGWWVMSGAVHQVDYVLVTGPGRWLNPDLKPTTDGIRNIRPTFLVTMCPGLQACFLWYSCCMSAV